MKIYITIKIFSLLKLVIFLVEEALAREMEIFNNSQETYLFSCTRKICVEKMNAINIFQRISE